MTRIAAATTVSILLATIAIAAPQRPVIAKPEAPADLRTPPADAERATGGLLTKVLTPGGGDLHPAESDFAHLRYSVWKASDGSVVDFTPARIASFVAVDKLLPGMRAMLMKMVSGESRRGWISADLGAGKIAAGETFVVDAELIDIVHPPEAPSDVAAIPPDAQLTKSGLAFKVLRPGSGTVHPRRRDTAIVQYSGWTTDGKLFDTSITRDEPAALPLLSVIPGWTEGLQLMTVGERVRLWIPSVLAYRNEEGKPQGMLVFDVELIGIK